MSDASPAGYQRRFSRHLPSVLHEPAPAWSEFALAALALAILVGLIASAPFRIMVTILLSVGLAATAIESRRIGAMVCARAGEDIGTFARAFDRRAPGFDPRVLRATWDALQAIVDPAQRRFPLRPSDDFEKDFRMDDHDLEDALLEVLDRTGRSRANTSSNPMYGRVRTVADLVGFATHQPGVRRRTGSSSETSPALGEKGRTE